MEKKRGSENEKAPFGAGPKGAFGVLAARISLLQTLGTTLPSRQGQAC